MALKEHFAKAMSHFSDVIVPHLKRLLETDKSEISEEYSQSEEELYLDLIHKIVAEASLQPDKVLINMCLDYCLLPKYKIRILLLYWKVKLNFSNTATKK